MKSKKIIAALCALAVVVSSAGGLQFGGLRLFDTAVTASAAFTIAKTVPYIGYTYDDNGITASSENQCQTYTSVTSSTTTWNNGWYVVDSNVTISSRITVNGNNVHLILCDGCTLTAPAGIQVDSGKSLAIYGQSESTNTMGTLISKNSVDTSGNAGIGGNNGKPAGTVIVNGGKIYTRGSKITGNIGAGAGIGGGYKGAGGTVYINGGFVSIPQVKAVAGIGGGTQATGGKIVINGGTVSAASYAGSAIGCGWNSSGATVYINGGTVNANTYSAGWGIGGANSTVRITGGTVSASGNSSGYAIGGTKANVTITGGTVTAYSQKYNAIEQTITFGSNMTARAGTENDFNKALPCFDYPSKKGKYVRVWEHTHLLSYECEGSHFAVKCANENCNLVDGELGLTLYADDKEYDGTAYDLQHSDCDNFTHTFADEFKLLTGKTISIGAIELYSGENKIDEAVDPGRYTAKQTVRVNNEEYTVEKSFRIIGTDPAYTITIPATVNIDGGTAEFKAEDVTLPDGAKINITVDGDNTESGQTTFNAKNEAKDSTVQYTIKNGDADVADGGTAMTFTGNDTQTLTFAKKADSTPTYAGTHTEKLTFGISVAEYVPSLADAFEDGALINVTLSVHGAQQTYSFKNENGIFTPPAGTANYYRPKVGLKKDDSGSLVVEASGYVDYSLQSARSNNCLCIYTFDTQSNKYSYVKQATVIDEAEFVSISVNGVDIPVTQA